MTLTQAQEKAKSPMAASNGDPNAYAIPSELVETTKSLIGKTLTAKNGAAMTIVEWVGQNYVFVKTGTEDYDCAPVMYVQKIKTNMVVSA